MRSMVPLEQGWDSFVVEVDGEWIFRFPLRPEVERMLARELRLLPALARRLPLPVPQPELVSDEGIGYRKLPGRALSDGDLTPEVAAQLGRFLGRLHGFPVERALKLRVVRHDLERDRTAFRERVLPLLGDDRPHGEALLAAAAGLRFEPALVHADLGAEHVLVEDGRISGIVDWSDTRLGDPAIDLAWLLNATPPDFADAVLAGYPGRDEPGLRERALVWHRLGPWHEVVYGLEVGGAGYVESGLAGVRARLPAAG